MQRACLNLMARWSATGRVTDRTSIRDGHRLTSLCSRASRRDILACRAIIDKQIIHIRDIDSKPGLNPVIKAGQKSVLAIPLLREGDVIGSILINKRETGGLSATVRSRCYKPSPSRQ